MDTTSANPAPATTASVPEDPIPGLWHDITCPEGTQCRDRSLHALGSQLVNSGVLHRLVREHAAHQSSTGPGAGPASAPDPSNENAPLPATIGRDLADARVITMVAELSALERGSVVIDTYGHTLTKGGPDSWWCVCGNVPAVMSDAEVLEEHNNEGPLTVLWEAPKKPA